MLVIESRHLELSVNVILKAVSTVAPMAAINVGGGGAGRLKLLEVIPVNPSALKLIVAPVTGPKLVAVKPLNVTSPDEAATDVTPFNVHAPNPTVAVTNVVLAVALPY